MAVSPPMKAGPNTIFNGLVTECESLTQDAQGVSSSTVKSACRRMCAFPKHAK